MAPRPAVLRRSPKVDGSSILRAGKPVFDKHTEDGIRFRIYRRGALEVRTLQAADAEDIYIYIYIYTERCVLYIYIYIYIYIGVLYKL